MRPLGPASNVCCPPALPTSIATPPPSPSICVAVGGHQGWKPGLVFLLSGSWLQPTRASPLLRLDSVYPRAKCSRSALYTTPTPPRARLWAALGQHWCAFERMNGRRQWRDHRCVELPGSCGVGRDSTNGPGLFAIPAVVSGMRAWGTCWQAAAWTPAVTRMHLSQHLRMSFLLVTREGV